MSSLSLGASKPATNGRVKTSRCVSVQLRPCDQWLHANFADLIPSILMEQRRGSQQSSCFSSRPVKHTPGNVRRKRSHFSVENGPTPAIRFGARRPRQDSRVRWLRLGILDLLQPCSCSSTAYGLRCRRRMKRSQALRGRNRTRDNPADGAPMALQMAPPIASAVGGVFRCHWTPVAMPKKIHLSPILCSCVVAGHSLFL